MAIQPKKIVVFGGGTGIGPVLEGLKDQGAELVAVVPPTDRGGSSRYMYDHNLTLLPPGDAFKAMVAMSDLSEEHKLLLKTRLPSGSVFESHSIANLLAVAAEMNTVDYNESWDFLCRVFNISGKVRPSSLNRNSELCIKRANGQITKGEDAIDNQRDAKLPPIVDVFLDPAAQINPELAELITQADAIVFAGGSFYTSTAPNVLTTGVPEAIHQSKAKVFLVANLANEPGHTTGWTAHRYAIELNRYLAPASIDVLLANNGQPSHEAKEQYLQEGEDITLVGEMPADVTYETIEADLISGEIADRQKGDPVKHRSVIRHSGERLARRILMAIE